MAQSSIKLAGCIIRDSTGRILLLHRNTPRRQQWEIPGGKIEQAELTSEAAIREIKEELGVDVKIIKKLGSKEFTEDDKVMNYTWFLAEIYSGKPKVMEKDTFDDLRYFSLSGLESISGQLSPNLQNYLLMAKNF